MSEWRGLHNPDWHRIEASGLTSCRSCRDTGCSQACPCYCCLAAEAERLVKRLTAALADRDRRIKAALTFLDSCPMPPDVDDGWTRAEIDAWGAGIEFVLQHLDALRGESDA